MQATVWGGAGEHGRSCYLIEEGQTRVVLDCGVKKEGNGEYPLLDEGIVPRLDAVFLSHAHEDHSMAIPLLYAMGYTGIVWTTRATCEQLPAYFAAWKRYVVSQGADLPYAERDIAAIRYAYIDEQVAAGAWLQLSPQLSVCWGRSGHLAGSIWLLLNIAGSLVFYSGDYTAESALLAADWPRLERQEPSQELEPMQQKQQLLARLHEAPQQQKQPVQERLHQSQSQERPHNKPQPHRLKSNQVPWLQEPANQVPPVSSEAPPITLAIIDAAYGMDSEQQQHKLEQLCEQINRALQLDAAVLLPVPTYGRGQEMLLWARETFVGTQIFVEQEIAAGLEKMLQEPEWLHPDAVTRIQYCLADPQIVIVDSEAKREQAVSATGGRIIFTNDGMLQSARSQWYYEQLSQHTDGVVILTGHLAKGSFAHQLLHAGYHTPSMQRTFYGRAVPASQPTVTQVFATVPTQQRVQFIRYKVHQGLQDVRLMLDSAPSKHTLLVHTGRQATEAVCEQLKQEGYAGLHALSAGSVLKL
ncbi:MBL fold metallo-hydrolase [Paenibacillus agricola]|uniref:MBL fold metallo-hydrolase n=1 Tax=Paenibacillus agricola TaxID=2716264 RepID=A0ABX0JB85_9BACL|nr:MBL fold metallo-hydrolase [Paenibacillus agricola]NHN33036.1 MBL fold metallo-hydrolase [Paenibacillus agricola]